MSADWNVSSALLLAGASVPASPSGPLRPGQRLGERFEVRDLLGRGGMGAVYRAWDRELDREVAVKIALNRSEPVSLERFRREGQLAATLQHPGVVRVHEAGEVDGAPYLVCELVEGARTLDQAFEGLPCEARLQKLIELARALGYAHARGVVHRDVKPGNVLVGRDGRLRLADFGLATAIGLTRLTRSGALVGTPSHMAPEQLRASRHEVGPPTDVWAVGVILYWVLTGAQPFRAEALLARIVEVLEGRFLRPRELDPSVTPALEAVCLRALRPDPGRRYPDGEALADALEAALAGEPPAPPQRPRAMALALGLGTGWALIVTAGTGREPPAPILTPRWSAPESREDPDAGLRALLAAEAPHPLVLEAWLAAHPSHPQAGEARAALERERLRATQRPVWTVPAPGLEVDAHDLAFAGGADPQLVALVEQESGARFLRWRWHAQEGRGEPLPSWPERPLRLIDWTLEGELLAALGGGRCRLVQLDAALSTRELDAPRARRVILAPGLERLAFVESDGIEVVSLAGPEARQVWRTGELGEARFSLDGRRVAALRVLEQAGLPVPELVVWELGRAEPVARSAPIPRGKHLIAHARGWLVSDDGRELTLLGHEAQAPRVLPVAFAKSVYGVTPHVAFAFRGDLGYVLSRRSVLGIDMARFVSVGERFPLGEGSTYRGFALDPSGQHLVIAVMQTGRPDLGQLEAWLLPRD